MSVRVCPEAIVPQLSPVATGEPLKQAENIPSSIPVSPCFPRTGTLVFRCKGISLEGLTKEQDRPSSITNTTVQNTEGYGEYQKKGGSRRCRDCRERHSATQLCDQNTLIKPKRWSSRMRIPKILDSSPSGL